jgi:hypothetical protein
MFSLSVEEHVKNAVQFEWIYAEYKKAGRNSIFATRYGLDGRGIESRWGEIFPVRLDRPRDSPSLFDSVYRFFPVTVTAEDHPSLPVPRLGMGGFYTSASPLCQHAHVMSCRPLACTICVKGGLPFSSKCVCLVKQQQKLSCSDTLFLKRYSQEANLVRWQHWSALIRHVSRVDSAVCLGY